MLTGISDIGPHPLGCGTVEAPHPSGCGRFVAAPGFWAEEGAPLEIGGCLRSRAATVVGTD